MGTDNSMRVGILTYHRAINYGAYLQACALCGRLNEEEGIDAEIIDYRMRKEIRRYDVPAFSPGQKLGKIRNGTLLYDWKKWKAFQSALSDPVMKRSAQSLTSDSLDAFRDYVRGKYDAIVVGSDEIWKADNFRGFPNAYWLTGVEGCRKLSYAASARIRFREVLPEAEYGILRESLADFAYIGVRDRLTLEEVRQAGIGEERLGLCCDPSFLYDFDLSGIEAGEILRRCRGFSPSRRTVLVMLDDEAAARAVRRALGGDYNLVSVFHRHRGMINVPGLSPLQWLACIARADFVVASFFHAICFSIVRNRPFLAVATEGKRSKLSELLQACGLSDRLAEAGRLGEALSGRGLQDLMAPVDFSPAVAAMRRTFPPFLEALRG